MTLDPKQSLKRLSRIGSQVLESCRGLEPSDSEIFLSHSVSTKVVFEAKDFSISSSHENTTAGLRSIVGGRLGFVTSNSLDSENLQSFAKESQLMARLSPHSPHNSILKSVTKPLTSDLWDSQLSQMGPREVLKWANLLVEECRKDARVTIDRAEVSLNLSSWAVLNSAGLEMSGAQTTADFFVMGMAKEDGEVTSFDYDGGTSASSAEVEESVTLAASRFRESVVNSLKPKKAKSYKGAVLLHPYAVLDLLGQVITANVNGQAHAEGLSPWRSQVGETIASPFLDAFEDPTDRTRVAGWMPFDREGVLTRRNELISEGRLSFVAHNLFSASRSGTQTTGNAQGGASMLPKVGVSNFGIKASRQARKLDDTALMGDLRQGLCLKRFSGNMDPYSGHFSGVAKNSWWIENGQYAHPVSEVMVAGNLFELLKQIVGIGENPHRLMSSGLAPYVLVDQVSVTSS